MILATLYKQTSNGKVQQWAIELDGSRFRTVEGLHGGAQTTSEWTLCKAKGKGAAATTPSEQAEKEALAKIKKQKDKGYTENIADVAEAKKKISPMLAHKFPDHEEYAMSQRGGLAIQPKLDGIRCVATRNGLFTRNGKPIEAAPHVFEEIKKLFTFFDADITFDGELYNHELKQDFNKITSLVKKQKPDGEDLRQSAESIQYHIYDINDLGAPTQGNFAQRNAFLYQLLRTLLPSCRYLKLVDTVFLGGNPRDMRKAMDEKYAEWLEAGYEGQMVRVSESTYSDSRSKNLLKRKEFIDQEFTILDIEEGVGNRSGMMGRIKFDLGDGRTFDSNARGGHDYFRELLINKHKYIGKKATVRYQNLTPAGMNVDQSGKQFVDKSNKGGMPRFPVMIAIRDYE